MDRLTARTETGHAYLVNVKPDEQEVDSPYKNTLQCILDCFERLAQYEDAEEQGLLVRLPCKVGDTVWFLTKSFDIENETHNYSISEYIVTETRGNKFNPLWYMASNGEDTHRDFHPTEIGKTVFLTREEAEEALKGAEHERD